MEELAVQDAELTALKEKVKGDWARQKRRDEKLAQEQESMVKFYEEQLRQRKAGSAKTSAEISVLKTKLADDKAKREKEFSALVKPRVAPPKQDVEKEPRTRTKESLPNGAVVKVHKPTVRKATERAPLDPHDSLMPVKERLRAEQQRLNRSEKVKGIEFYREQYKARMKKIIEISELPVFRGRNGSPSRELAHSQAAERARNEPDGAVTKSGRQKPRRWRSNGVGSCRFRRCD